MGGFLAQCHNAVAWPTCFTEQTTTHTSARAGEVWQATTQKKKSFVRSIHNLESSYFRTKFEPTLDRFKGCNSGIGIISDTDAQPLVFNSHLGRFAIATVAKVDNLEELTQEMMAQKHALRRTLLWQHQPN